MKTTMGLPTKPWPGPTIVVLFDRKSLAAEALGMESGKVCYPWSGHPRPLLGERWKCSILTTWTEGSMQGSHWPGGHLVRPMERLS